MLEKLQNIFKIPELKRKVLITLGLLTVYRIGAHIPTPGINGKALAAFFSSTQGTLLGFFDMFSGGALSRLTVFALGIMPYIDAAIILELLTVVFPLLERLAKEGEQGRKKLTQYTRYGTIFIAIIQGLGISFGLEGMKGPSGEMVVINPGWGFRVITVITLTAGTAFIMWLGEQISERGIGNGISLIIFSGIVVRAPAAIINTYRLVSTGEMQLFVVLILLVIMALVIASIIFVESGERRVMVQYAKRVVGRKMYGGQSTHIPLKVNTAGVIPVIFASSIIMLPATLARFVAHPWAQKIADLLSPGSVLNSLLYVIFIIFFCYFYTAIVFNPIDLADNMKKYGGYIPGIRPGKSTAEHINKILTRITFAGAIYLTLITLLPTFMIKLMNVPFYFGGIALLIVVQVALDTVRQTESHLMMRYYDGFMKKAGMRKA
ncbi:MAG: preprotein translocase subunit SecY [Candidatus Schekmanbacteria bacterium]|nr:preprotein translocase subunit SecY [Candidatus Schekmanbacteria bacterium]